MWLQENLFETSILIGFAIMILLFWSMVTGIRYLQLDQRLDDKSHPRIASLYIACSGNRKLEFIFFLLLLEPVFIIMIVLGLVLSIPDPISLLISVWFAPLGLFCMALLMTLTGPQSAGN
jgi:hypothetical protein